MRDDHTKGEMHGCIVCGRLHQLYVVYDSGGKFIDCKVMSTDGKRVPDADRPLVACRRHKDSEIEAAVKRVFGKRAREDDD